MSVPAYNLYDFVHQATKRRYWMLYFKPWGSRDLGKAIAYQPSIDHIQGPNGLDPNEILVEKILPQSLINCTLIQNFQPILFCHDQEPLNFDLYQDGSPELASLREKYKDNEIGNQCHFPDQNLRFAVPWSWQKQWILLHSEKNSNELIKYESTGQYVGAYWWSHAMIARDWYRYAQHDGSLNYHNWQKLFLVYNRESTGSREYRKQFASLVESHEVSQNCQVGSWHNEPVESDYSARYDSIDFCQTAISVVLETVFTDNRIHFTEKILRPIACGHPFIVASGPGALKLLKSYGFQTFAPWIHEDYDTIENPDQRLEAIVKEMQRLAKLDKSQQNALLEHCRQIAQFNKQHFFSESFYNVIVKELQTNVSEAGSKLSLEPSAYLRSRRIKKQHRVTSLQQPWSRALRPYLITLARQLRTER